MRPAITDQQRRHRLATSKAMKRIVWHCDRCGRGQNQRPIDLIAEGAGLVWVCRFKDCQHEQTSGEQK